MLDIWNLTDGQDNWWDILIKIWMGELEVLECLSCLFEWYAFF